MGSREGLPESDSKRFQMEWFIWKMIPGAAGRDTVKGDRGRKAARKAWSIKPATPEGEVTEASVFQTLEAHEEHTFQSHPA